MKRSTIYQFYFLFCPLNPNNICSEYVLLGRSSPKQMLIKHLICGRVYSTSYKAFVKTGRRCKCQRGEKIKKTIQTKYGVDNCSQIDSVKKQKIETCTENYGVANPSQSITIQKKKEQTFIKNWGETHHFKNETFFDNKQFKNHKEFTFPSGNTIHVMGILFNFGSLNRKP